MLKRTRGYVLLTLLVLTGFAGQVSNQTISSKERTLLVSRLKVSKQALLKSLDDITPAQLTFKAGTSETTIGDKILMLNATQTALLANVDAAINGGKNSTIDLYSLPKNSTPDFNDLIDEVKATQSFLVKYAKTTTEDLHAHTLKTTAGPVDAYQALLTLPVLTENCLAEIEALKKHRRFPK
jgi:hypothetical protein